MREGDKAESFEASSRFEVDARALSLTSSGGSYLELDLYGGSLSAAGAGGLKSGG